MREKFVFGLLSQNWGGGHSIAPLVSRSAAPCVFTGERRRLHKKLYQKKKREEELAAEQQQAEALKSCRGSQRGC